MDLEKMLSDRTVSLKPSGIRRFFDIANEMEGVIALGVGEPDFKTPYSVRQAAIQNLQHGQTRYTANAGLSELRRAISDYLKRKFDLAYDKKDEILVTVGGSEAIDLAIRAFLNPGDEVLIPEPCFVCYSPIVTLTSGVPVSIQTREEDEFRLTPEQLEAAITPKTKMLVLPYPNNPTGAVMRREHLEAIAEVIRRHDIIVLSDEIYAELTYNGRHVSIASLPGMKERTIVVNGFSKTFAMTGWRLGYAAGPAAAIKQMTKLHQYAIMCAPTTAQYAAIVALDHCEENIRQMREEYNTRRRFVVDAFNKMGLHTFEPEGAFYVFPCIKSTGLGSEEFCERLLYEKKVAVVPGNAFGDSGEGFIRVSYSYSVQHLSAALRRIAEFLQELKGE
ncbi:MAG TPA: aminotransferase class I/II-fold pyridoxal phosphate-dependent enzyme [Candidatus Merdivicinus faecavium]|nr:aminotransferase class I/II-fold pyridoxal phosphate-dependent enzyme [Candidatus Merdivicinus faecavium]